MKRWQFILLACAYAFFGRDGTRGQSTQPLSTPQPPCVISFQFTAIGTSKVLDNRNVGCVNFAISVSVPSTVSGLSIVLQTAQDNGSTNCSTCSWTTFSPATGANPITSTSGGNATFTTPAGATYYEYLRVQLTSLTGTGSIQGKVIGTLALSASGGPPPAAPGCPSGPVPSVQYAISSTKCAGSSNFTYQTATVIPTPTFSGSGLNDMTAAGTYSDGLANPNAYFTVTLSATGTPDHFTWSKNGGSMSAPVAITGSAQSLSNGVTITFAATTGHTLGVSWTVQTQTAVTVLLGSYIGGNSYLGTQGVNEGGPNNCPVWYWGDSTCQLPAALIANQDVTGDLAAANAFNGVAGFFGNFVHNGTIAAIIQGAGENIVAGGTGPWAQIIGNTPNVAYNGSNVASQLFASYAEPQSLGGTVNSLYSYYSFPVIGPGATAGNVYGFYSTFANTGTISSAAYSFWSQDLSALSAPNSYYSWFDSRGVRRVKEDNTYNSVGQAIEALYNPQFTKYTPGATNFERLILGQWNSNVAEIGTQAGGTGTLRALRIIGPSVEIPVTTFANLGLPDNNNSTMDYCSDCTVTSSIDNTCAGSGSGAQATRINGVWKCLI